MSREELSEFFFVSFYCEGDCDCFWCSWLSRELNAVKKIFKGKLIFFRAFSKCLVKCYKHIVPFYTLLTCIIRIEVPPGDLFQLTFSSLLNMWISYFTYYLDLNKAILASEFLNKLLTHFVYGGSIFCSCGPALKLAAVFFLIFVLLGDTVVVNEQSLLRVY